MMTAPDAAPLLNLRGAKVALGPLRRDLISSYTLWINEFEGQATLSGRLDPVTKDQRTNSYERWSRDRETSNLTIYEAASLRPIGVTGIWMTDRFAYSG